MLLALPLAAFSSYSPRCERAGSVNCDRAYVHRKSYPAATKMSVLLVGPQVDGQQEACTVAPEREKVQEQILERILGQLIYDPTEGVRAAACVWLVSLCRFTGRQPRLLARLADIQEAFSSLLGDSSEIAQARSQGFLRHRLPCACFQCVTSRRMTGDAAFVTGNPSLEEHAITSPQPL